MDNKNKQKMPTQKIESKEEYYASYCRAQERFKKQQEELYQQHPEWRPKEKSLEEDNKKYDHPDTMDDDVAKILYIAVMLGAVIFTDRLLIWIVATIVYLRFKNRHNIRKNKR